MLIRNGELNKCGIYKISNGHGVLKYIGGAKECNDAYSRHNSNLINGEYAETNKHELQVLFNTEDLYFSVLAECSESELDLLETKYIKMYKDTIVNKDTKGKRRTTKSTPQETEKRRQANNGTKNPHNTKLNESDVIKIKEMLRKGVKQRLISEMYNISGTLVSNIRNGYRWASVTI
ncbi:hypothetical protein CLOBY_17980 [Clostridium saccharobutylicum]|uniref:hypothetical protein n=1 Tax=Clostridium saccharobutylicum TaxID=169679 RepID=UPI000983D4F7|nr:hypothetical protein [Clostridium saccharobutylicum]AQS09667.1 hypothetical protein CLOBY_17980 [Clostridium saccharobutylicum]MBC2436938.1 nuclease [Clostridium saccharobutylicum]NSB89289.1 hypothetical protein [Clostridium saccharobutylicum]NYC27943.1 hypothetical protein [Clostridium saccharobutylicum]OOM17138.1 hypothetical protein CLSAB_20860 [Clostridium saccharobutylicum]